MTGFIVMFFVGYLFHLAYKFFDKVFSFVIDAVRSKKNKARE